MIPHDQLSDYLERRVREAVGEHHALPVLLAIRISAAMRGEPVDLVALGFLACGQDEIDFAKMAIDARARQTNPAGENN